MATREHRYHSWRALRDLPHITLRWSAAVARGRVDGHTINLHPLLTQAELRSTLAHELVRLECGPVPDWAWPREEVIVEEIAARRLVGLDHLAESIVWHDGHAHDGMAEDLWADRAILLARINSLDRGNLPAGEVRHSDTQTWNSGLTKLDRKGNPTSEPLSATGVIYAHQVLDGILSMAVKDRRIQANPADDITLPCKVRKPNTYLTHKQLHALADADQHYRTLVLTLGYLGARWGEATALEVRHVNPLRRRLSIEQNLVQVDGDMHEGDPKGGRARTLPIPDFLMPLLAAQCEGKAPNDPLFTGRDGGRIRRPSTQRGWFQQAIKKAAVPRLTPHDLRHTAASLAVQSGANVKAVQRMLGHASAAMTLDLYADLFDDDLDVLAARLDSVVGRM